MPDTRSLLVAAIVALTFFIFGLIAWKPELANVQLFGVLATAVVSGGLGAAVGFYLGSSKGSADKDSVIAQLSKGSPSDLPPT